MSYTSYVVLHCPMRGTSWYIVGFLGTHVTCPMVAFRQALWDAGQAYVIGPCTPLYAFV